MKQMRQNVNGWRCVRILLLLQPFHKFKTVSKNKSYIKCIDNVIFSLWLISSFQKHSFVSISVLGIDFSLALANFLFYLMNWESLKNLD